MYRERVQNLLEVLDKKNEGQPGARDFVFNAVENSLKSFADYTNVVYSMETQIMIARHRIEDPKEYQELVMRLDQSRRVAHEGAIAATSMLNRVCDISGAERVYDGPDDRIAIGDFCGDIMHEFFATRTQARTISEKEVEQAFDQEVEAIEHGRAD